MRFRAFAKCVRNEAVQRSRTAFILGNAKNFRPSVDCPELALHFIANSLEGVSFSDSNFFIFHVFCQTSFSWILSDKCSYFKDFRVKYPLKHPRILQNLKNVTKSLFVCYLFVFIYDCMHLDYVKQLFLIYNKM